MVQRLVVKLNLSSTPLDTKRLGEQIKHPLSDCLASTSRGVSRHNSQLAAPSY